MDTPMNCRSLAGRCALGAMVALLGLCVAVPGQGRIRMERGEELLWRLPLEERLRRPLSVHLESATLEDVMDFLRATLDLNIVVSPAVWAHEQHLVNLRLQDLDGERVLNWVMMQTGLTYIYHHGAVLVTTPEHARQVETQYFRIYDIRDLAASPVRARNGGRGDGDARAVQVQAQADDQQRRRSGGADIVSLIVMLTGPENWKTAVVLGGPQEDDDRAGGWFMGADDF